LGAGGRGVSERVAVTAASLARELNVRLDNAVSGGVGISISQNLIELPGGDPTDPADDVLSYTISAGLPGNTDTVGFAGLTLGALQTQGAQPVTSIVNAISKTATTSVRQLRLVTEEGLFTSQWIRDTQIEDNTLTLGKIQQITDFRVLGRSGTNSTGNVQQVTVRTSVRTSATDTVLVTEKAVRDALDSAIGSLENALLNQPLVLSVVDNGLNATQLNSYVNSIVSASNYPQGKKLVVRTRYFSTNFSYIDPSISYTAPTLGLTVGRAIGKDVKNGQVVTSWDPGSLTYSSGSASFSLSVSSGSVINYINNGTAFVRV
jgi:hypothetical protein